MAGALRGGLGLDGKVYNTSLAGSWKKEEDMDSENWFVRGLEVMTHQLNASKRQIQKQTY
jgi:hypothetical protein